MGDGSVQTYRRLSDAPPGAWRTVSSAGGLYCSEGWLNSHQRFEPTYVLIEEGGEPIAGAPCHTLVPGAFTARYDVREVFLSETAGLAAAPAVPDSILYPSAICGPRWGFKNHLLVRPDLTGPARRAALARLVETAQGFAREAGAPLLVFPYLAEPEVRELEDVLGPGAISALVGLEGYLEVPPSFEAYLAGNPRRQSMVRRECRRFQAHRFQVELRRLSECRDAITPLVTASIIKYFPGATWEQFSAAVRDLLIEGPIPHLDAASRVFVATRDGQPLACSVLFECDGVLYARMVGNDYQKVEKESSAYFNLLFYAPLRQAIQDGIRQIHVGLESMDTKVHRGCRVRALYFVLWPMERGALAGIEGYLAERSLQVLRREAAEVVRYAAWPDQLEVDLGQTLARWRIDPGELRRSVESAG